MTNYNIYDPEAREEYIYDPELYSSSFLELESLYQDKRIICMNDLQLQIEDIKNKFVETSPKIIDVDEGWYQLIVDCDKELTKIDPDYKIYQIKQKFGRLRYYHQSSKAFDEQIYLKTSSVISKYENLSACTCEATGKPGVLMKSLSGWYKTLNPQWTASSDIYKHYKIVKHDSYEY